MYNGENNRDLCGLLRGLNVKMSKPLDMSLFTLLTSPLPGTPATYTPATLTLRQCLETHAEANGHLACKSQSSLLLRETAFSGSPL